MSTTTASDTRTETTTPTRRPVRRLLAVGGLVGAIALGAAACSSGSGSSNAAKNAAKTASSVVPAAVQAAAPAGPSGPVSQPAGTQSGSQTSPQPGGSATPPPPSGPAPTITSFTTPDNIDCHNGNFQNFSASWTTDHAVKTTISIDGPGVYATYDANASVSLPFNCSSSHTFLLTAYGADGQTATQSVTLDPRNVQTTTPDPNQ